MYYVDGTWVQAGQAGVHPEDRGYQFGDGIYEVVRIYRGNLYQWDAHLARLLRSAKELRMLLPWSQEELTRIASELPQKNDIGADEDAILYLQITRGAAPRQFEFPDGIRPVLSAYARRKPRPIEEMNRGVAAAVVPDIRWLRCDIKSLNLLGAVLARQAAKEAGAFEAIQHRDGIVTEGSSSNVFAVKDRRLYTHPATNLILNGVTRQTVIGLAREEGIPVVEEAFDLTFLAGADEVFITSTTSEVMPVVSIDGRPVGSGQIGGVTRRLQASFERHILANPRGVRLR